MLHSTPVLGIDHGEKRIGVAISDASRTIARPLTIIKHVSREKDARRILQLAEQHNATAMVMGQSLNDDGMPNMAGRRAATFAQYLSTLTNCEVVLWDEAFSTQDARQWRLASGASRKKRAAPDDAAAATLILQSFLEAQRLNRSKHKD